MNFPVQGIATVETAPAAAAGSTAGSLMQMSLSLAVVLAVIFALAWVLRWVQSTRGAGATGALRITSGLQVGAKERVLLVQAGDTHLLIGVAPGRVQTLHVFSECPVATAPAAAEPSMFADKLKQLLKREPPQA
jgi:flagellar protein FliO/FliZ